MDTLFKDAPFDSSRTVPVLDLFGQNFKVGDAYYIVDMKKFADHAFSKEDVDLGDIIKYDKISYIEHMGRTVVDIAGTPHRVGFETHIPIYTLAKYNSEHFMNLYWYYAYNTKLEMLKRLHRWSHAHDCEDWFSLNYSKLLDIYPELITM